jgi:hypothetical protein
MACEKKCQWKMPFKIQLENPLQNAIRKSHWRITIGNPPGEWHFSMPLEYVIQKLIEIMPSEKAIVEVN